MNIVSIWDTLKTGTALWAIVGGAGLLIVGLALVMTHTVSWLDYGIAAWTIVNGVMALIHQRRATLSVQVNQQKLLDAAKR